MHRARLRSVTICCHLALQAVRQSPESSLTSIALVCFASLCMTGAHLGLAQLAQLARRLAEGGKDYRAHVDISQCPQCIAARNRSPYLQRLVTETHTTAVVLLPGLDPPGEQHDRARGVGNPNTRRAVPVFCLPSTQTPPGVRWRSRAHRTGWSDDVGSPAVVLGADLAPYHRQDMANTSRGAWRVAGYANRRAAVAYDAVVNGGVLVPYREPFMQLCDAGQPAWQLTATDTTQLIRMTEQLTDELRTVTALRASVRPSWRIIRLDRFTILVERLVRRVRWWVLLLPLGITVLCGAGVFSVQTLQSEQRRGEFGIRRAVGASGSLLLGQLVAESVCIGVSGLGLCAGLLYAMGVIQVDSDLFVRVALPALMVVLPLTVIGVLIPGVAALRSASIAQLEGRSD